MTISKHNGNTFKNPNLLLEEMEVKVLFVKERPLHFTAHTSDFDHAALGGKQSSKSESSKDEEFSTVARKTSSSVHTLLYYTYDNILFPSQCRCKIITTKHASSHSLSKACFLINRRPHLISGETKAHVALIECRVTH